MIRVSHVVAFTIVFIFLVIKIGKESPQNYEK